MLSIIRPSRLLAGLVGAALLAGAVSVLAAAPAHADTTITQFTWSSGGASDFVGQGTTGSVTPPPAFIVTGTVGDVTVKIPNADYWSVELAAPLGSQLMPGPYNNANRAAFRTAGHPGLDVSGMHRGCNNVAGSFTIYAISADAAGKITMLDAAFTQYCESIGNAPLNGTIKYQAPAAAPMVVTAVNPTTVTNHATMISANLTGNGVTTGSAQVYVDGSYQFSLNIYGGLATGSIIAKYGTHTVTVVYTGDATHPYASGTTTIAVLQGARSLTFESSAGDYIGAGATAVFSSENSTVGISGTRSSLTMSATTANDWWYAMVSPPTGQQLQGNTDYTTSRFADATHAGLDFFGDGRGCNNSTGTLHITEIGTDGSGNVNYLGADFHQYCESASNPYVYGHLRWNWGGVTSTTLTVNPTTSTVYQPVTMTATVTGTNPTGTVTFTNGSTTLGTANLVATSPTTGQATFTTSSLPYNPYEQYVQGHYSGDWANQTSWTSIITIHVNRVTATATLSATPTTASSGQNIAFTVPVTGTSPILPTGDVYFYDGTTKIATVPLTNGSATFNTSGLAAGSHNVYAYYIGDNFNTYATSPTVAVTVNKWSTTATLTAQTLNPKANRTDELTATVTTSGPTPTGTLTFYDGTTVLGTYTMTSNSVTIAGLFSKGTHTVKAVYSGDATHNGSTTNVLTITAK